MIVTRPEFDALRADVKTLEGNQVKLETLLNVQQSTLTAIKEQGDRREARENQRDGAIKAAIWVAGILGPAGVGTILLTGAKALGIVH
ncbi:hypothetical protein HLH33_02490 [Gluconacetobacter diazotrophicus]|uniref:Uncharacterized protein n=1 Tax=Gluconacetobacter diazotrophicus TaxID=33996 RepID=A0A7W4FCD8_GLUDI|nr:hypothetical protein [Gluconacetobacter diazotrophicus]MBB2155186.1 hypothetical protein [Gluconacetobacter diazotrophicus]